MSDYRLRRERKRYLLRPGTQPVIMQRGRPPTRGKSPQPPELVDQQTTKALAGCSGALIFAVLGIGLVLFLGEDSIKELMDGAVGNHGSMRTLLKIGFVIGIGVFMVIAKAIYSLIRRK